MLTSYFIILCITPIITWQITLFRISRANLYIAWHLTIILKTAPISVFAPYTLLAFDYNFKNSTYITQNQENSTYIHNSSQTAPILRKIKKPLYRAGISLHLSNFK